MQGDDVPWTTEKLKPGDRVRFSERAIRCNVPAKSRREIKGRVVKVETGVNGTIWTIHVLWDGYKRAHDYAGIFITKVRKAGRSPSPTEGGADE